VAVLVAFGTARAGDPGGLEFRRPEIPSERNAVEAWHQAARGWKAPDAAATAAFASAWKPGPWKASEEADRICALHRDALSTVEASLSLAEAQWPGRKTGGDPLDPAMAALRGLQQARLYLARRALAEGRPDESVAMLLGSVRLGQRACEARGALIHYLVGNGLRRQAERSIRDGAVAGWFDAARLQALAAGLGPLDTEPEVFATVIRVEWTDYELPRPDPVADARRMANAYATNPELTGILVPEGLERLHRIFWDPALVAGHPAAIDHDAMRDRMAARYRRWMANVRRPWAAREVDPPEAMAAQARLLADAAALLKRVEKEPFPLSAKAIRRIQPLYNRIGNPIGRLLVACEDVIKVSSDVVFRVRAEREATRGTLALARFRTNRGRWPHDWTEVVAEGLIAAPPADPFSGGTLHYSAAPPRVWSVGENGKDDGGKSTGEGPWAAADAVWPIDPPSGKAGGTP